MKLNEKQQAVVRNYLLSNQSILVLASAGTGKSTLLAALSQHQKRRHSSVYVAFTNAAKKVMQTKMPMAYIRTTYSLGFEALRSVLPSADVKVTKNKASKNYDELIENGWRTRYIEKVNQEMPVETKLKQDVLNLVTKALLNCQRDIKGILGVANQVGFVVLQKETEIEWAAEFAAAIIDTGRKQLFASEGATIDFSEMIAWPAMLSEVKPKQFQEVFVDECQDLSLAQVQLLRKSLVDNGQLVAVGDSHQAIYGFAGASTKSLQIIKELFNCVELPLTINYRCGKSIIRYAREIDPNIEAHSGAPEGQILDVHPEDAYVYAINNPHETWFICRTNAKLIQLGLRMVAEGVKFRYQRDVIEDRLTGLIWQFEAYHGGSDLAKNRWNLFRAWLTEQKGKAKTADQSDLIEALTVFYDRYQPGSSSKLKSAIARFFRQHSKKANITLSTIHACKGTESHTVVYWGTNLVPHSLATTTEEREQERNLELIARTRAIQTLIKVDLDATKEHEKPSPVEEDLAWSFNF